MQLKLVTGTWSKDRFAFGGALLKGSHPKKKRYFRPSLPLHVVMRSGEARGSRSFFVHAKAISGILSKQSSKHSVRIYSVANAGNHLHLIIQAPSQAHLSNFLRALTGRIAQKAGVKWDARPFSRIVSWGRDFKSVAQYISLNATEVSGLTRESARKMFEKIQVALKEGILPKTPGLVAAGFA